MAQLIEGDSRGLHRGLIGNTPGLPPRFPTLSNKGVTLSDLDKGFYCNQGRNAGTLGTNHRQHKRTPSCCVVMQNKPFLSDKAVEEIEFASTKGLHRRSASDSFTYLERSGNLSMFSNIAEEDESECSSAVSTEKAANQGNEDGDQLTDLLEEIQQLQNQQNLPISARLQSVHHNSDSLAVNTIGNARASLEAAPGHLSLESKGRCREECEYFLHDSINGDPNDLPESELDPKKAKRVLANRQSAQRSRVRKLQYIAELERIVSTLQTEVSSLSLQLIYLKHQRALLNMDNNALKQQVVFFVQEKRSKDSQNEVLMHDFRRLQKMSEFQLLRKSSQMQKQPQPQPQHHHIQRHSSLPSDFVAKIYEPELITVLQLEKSGASSMDELMKGFGGMSLDSELGQDRMSRQLDSSGVGTALAMQHTALTVEESFDGNAVAYDA